MNKKIIRMKMMTKDNMRAYVKPICKNFRLEWQPMMVNSVRGSMDNKDISQDPNDPWYTSQD